jgi:hypothetical protein
VGLKIVRHLRIFNSGNRVRQPRAAGLYTEIASRPRGFRLRFAAELSSKDQVETGLARETTSAVRRCPSQPTRRRPRMSNQNQSGQQSQNPNQKPGQQQGGGQKPGQQQQGGGQRPDQQQDQNRQGQQKPGQ